MIGREGTPVVFNLGILPRVEFVMDLVGTRPLAPESDEARYSIRDTDVFFKFLLLKGVLQDESGPSVALETGPLTPELYGEMGLGYSANLIFSERVGWLIMHLNNTAEWSRKRFELTWANSLITEFHFSETAWPVTELLWEREIKTGESVYSLLAGLIWSAGEGLDFDAAGLIASEDGKPAFGARFGLTWAFHAFGEEEEEGEERATR